MRAFLLATALFVSPFSAMAQAPGSDQFVPLPDTTDIATLAASANANAQASSEYGGNPISIQAGDCVIGQNCSLTDASGNVWTLAPSLFGNVGMGQVMENGQPSNYNGDGSWVVSLRLLANGQVAWQSAKGLGWFSDTFWGIADPGPSSGDTASISSSSDAVSAATAKGQSIQPSKRTKKHKHNQAAETAPSQADAVAASATGTPALTFAPGIGLFESESPSSMSSAGGAQPTSALQSQNAGQTLNVSPTPLASNNCVGETFYDNFQNGLGQWDLGNDGAPDPSGTNSFEGDPSSVIQTTASGLNMSVAPGGPSGILGSWLTTSSFSQKYGYFEAAINTPSSQGLSSAFWMYTQQPKSIAEIDAEESDGSTMTSSSHSATKAGTATWSAPVQAGYHVYAVDWEPNEITWYIDGQVTHQTATPSDFTAPMDIRLDMMAGGPQSYLGAPASGTTATAQVEYVRAFSSMQAALACVPDAQTPTTELVPQTNLSSALSMGGS